MMRCSFHIETRVEELQADGVPPDIARQRALREFGSRARVSEDTRAAWQVRWMEDSGATFDSG